MDTLDDKNKDDLQLLAESQNKFARDLYLALSRETSGNLFFSPFSISTALGMTLMGAKGNTEVQMKSVMHFIGDLSPIKKAFKDLIVDIKKVATDYELHTSNMAYISHTLSVLDDFSLTLRKDFLSTSKTVDFSNSEPVRKEINEAVEKETNSKIKNLIPSGILTEATQLVLVNAIYFKGLWQNQFDPADTKEQPFWITAEESVVVPMMTVSKYFRMVAKDELDATLLALDYQGGRMSMIILLPNAKDGLLKMEEKLATADLSKLDDDASSKKVDVFLPKFKLEETLELVPTLSSMGMADLFSEENCNLSGITGDRSLCVTNVIHKAFLEVNEEGSEAAAATAVVVVNYCLLINQTFVADHPFVFYIKDNYFKEILFAGKFCEPHA